MGFVVHDHAAVEKERITIMVDRSSAHVCFVIEHHTVAESEVCIG